MMPAVPEPPDWLIHWCIVYLAHVAPWLVRGLVVAHVALYAILFLQRRARETEAAKALRRFVLSKVSFWLLLAIAPSGGSSIYPGPWWIVAYAAVLTWIAAATAWLLAMLLWSYVVPALWPGHGGNPVHVETMTAPKPWDGIQRRIGPKDRRKPEMVV